MLINVPKMPLSFNNITQNFDPTVYINNAKLKTSFYHAIRNFSKVLLECLVDYVSMYHFIPSHGAILIFNRIFVIIGSTTDSRFRSCEVILMK